MYKVTMVKSKMQFHVCAARLYRRHVVKNLQQGGC